MYVQFSGAFPKKLPIIEIRHKRMNLGSVIEPDSLSLSNHHRKVRTVSLRLLSLKKRSERTVQVWTAVVKIRNGDRLTRNYYHDEFEGRFSKTQLNRNDSLEGKTLNGTLRRSSSFVVQVEDD